MLRHQIQAQSVAPARVHALFDALVGESESVRALVGESESVGACDALFEHTALLSAFGGGDGGLSVVLLSYMAAHEEQNDNISQLLAEEMGVAEREHAIHVHLLNGVLMERGSG